MLFRSVGVRHGRRVETRGDRPRDVRDVGHDTRADRARNLAYALEVYRARVGRSAADNHLRVVLLRQTFELVVVYLLRLARDAVLRDLVAEAGEVQGVAVREVPAVREVHAENRVAVLQGREVDGHVRLRARVRLHVRVLRAEYLLRASMAVC